MTKPNQKPRQASAGAIGNVTKALSSPSPDNGGFYVGAPIRKGVHPSAGPSQLPTQGARDPSPTWTGNHASAVVEWLPVTSIPGWNSAATEVVMAAGISLPIRSGMLCIALTDVPRAVAALDRTFGFRR